MKSKNKGMVTKKIKRVRIITKMKNCLSKNNQAKSNPNKALKNKGKERMEKKRKNNKSYKKILIFMYSSKKKITYKENL